jgi:hypothetical protein
MNENYDVIGLVSSGVPYASIIANEMIKEGFNVRFMAFYPVRMTPTLFKKINLKEDDEYNPTYIRLDGKRYMFEKKCHEKLNEILEYTASINKNDISNLTNKGHTYGYAKYLIVRNKWIEINHRAIIRKKDPLEEFVSNRRLRLSQEADPSRVALICDDVLYEGLTLGHAIYDLFMLGYKNIRIRIQESISNLNELKFKSYYEGDYETFIKNYKNSEPEHINLLDLITKEKL